MKFALIALILIFTAIVTAAAVIFRLFLMRPKVPKQPKDEYRKQRQKIRNNNNEYLLSKHPAEKEITSFDGLKLKGLLLSQKKSKKFAVLVHGYLCNGRDEMSHLARHYYDDLGFNCLLPDNRAHGKSEGKYIGFGFLDSFDILSWIDFLIKTYGDDIEIILHGISMGAATVMITAGNDKLPKQVKGVIEDCGYSDMGKEIRHVVKQKAKLSLPPVRKAADIICKIKAGYYFKDSSPVNALKKATVPILFIHGEEDDFVPTFMVRELYEAYEKEKLLLIVPGAAHARSYYIAKEEYDKHIDKLLGMAFKENIL